MQNNKKCTTEVTVWDGCMVQLKRKDRVEKRIHSWIASISDKLKESFEMVWCYTLSLTNHG